MRAVSGNGSGGRRPAERRRPSGPRPGEALIVGGFGPRGERRNPSARQRSKRRSTVRAAAPLAVPIALGVTLGIILAVSSGAPRAHVTQGNSGTSRSSTSAPSLSPAAPVPTFTSALPPTPLPPAGG
jgi:hypothetical protein